MAKVFVERASYNDKNLKAMIFEMMDRIAGNAFIRPGQKVLIKPNLLLPATPEKAILTHPLIVRAVAEYVLKQGASAQISDSPASGSFKRVFEQGGFRTALKGLDVEFKEFTDSLKVDIGPPFGEIDIAKDSVKADVMINLAKLKTHAQMGLTLGVKNTFGCIVGLRKPEWHFRSGIDQDRFAALLVQIHRAVDPAITLIDGITALEGHGPGKGGDPRPLGLLIGSANADSADRAVCEILGIDPDGIPTLRAASRLGFGGNGFEIAGSFDPINDFKFPDLGTLLFGPKVFQAFLRKHLIQRPNVADQVCRLCGECREICPAGAITQDDQHIFFDYNTCIRCYCCVEVCPHGALNAVETFPGR